MTKSRGFWVVVVFHLFCFLGGGEVEVQTEPFEIWAHGKEMPNESISIFCKTPFWTTGIQISLSCSWKKGFQSKLPPLSLLPSTQGFRKPPSQPSPSPYVSASGMCCDTCYLWIPLCPIALSLSHHPCFSSFPGEGEGDPSPSPSP